LLQEQCGGTTLNNIAIVTNMWGEVSHTPDEASVAEPASGDTLTFNKGAQFLRHNTTFEIAQEIV